MVAFVEIVEMNDWTISLIIVSVFILGFWLGVHWILEKEKAKGLNDVEKTRSK